MEEKMNQNKTIITLTIIAAVIMIALPTILKIYNHHEARLYEVATKKIIESAEECYRNQICKDHEITIRELKNTGYLETDIVNPKTKTFFDENIILEEHNLTVTFKE